MGIFNKDTKETPTPAGLDALKVAAPQPEVKQEAKPEAKPEATPKKVSTPEELLSPVGRGFVNDMVSTAVRESVRAIFAEMAPILQGMALTPEKLDLLRTPKKNEEQVARELRNMRESRKSKEDEAQLRRDRAAMQSNCPHKYPNNTDSISLIHNMPSRQVAGICVLCHSLIEGKRWTILAPDPETGKERAVIADAHPDYNRVLQIERLRA
jgi:hypothetical protein